MHLQTVSKLFIYIYFFVIRVRFDFLQYFFSRIVIAMLFCKEPKKNKVIMRLCVGLGCVKLIESSH